MKKIFLFLICFFILINLILAENKNEAEKYYNIAVKYYLEGKLDNALNVLIRALQNDKENIRYSTLYDIIIDEKEKLKVIKFNMPLKYENDNVNYDELISKINEYINKREQQQNQRILTLLNALSKENMEVKEYQEQILDKKIENSENKIKKIFTNLNYLFILLIIILFFLILIVIFFFDSFRKLSKIKESIKLLNLKQNEQQIHLLKIEEEQKKLNNKNF